MVKFDVLSFRNAVVCMILMVNGFMGAVEMMADFTFLKIRKGKLPPGNYKNKIEWGL